MGRPSHTDPATFTPSETVAATGMSLRNLQFLRDRKLGPFRRDDQKGTIYLESTFCHLVMTAALVQVSGSLTVAAFVADLMVDEVGGRAERLANPFAMDRRERHSARGTFAVFLNVPPEGRDNLFAPMPGDTAVVIVDRERVMRQTIKPTLDMAVGEGIDGKGPFAVGRLSGTGRGEEPIFTPVTDEVPHLDIQAPDGDTTWQDAVDAIERHYQAAARRAVATLTVNLSLAIRRAFGVVHTLRLQNGGPLW